MRSGSVRSAAFLVWLVAAPVVSAQTLTQDFKTLVETPAVSGREGPLVRWLTRRLASWHAEADAAGNVVLVLGHGQPQRLLVAAVDEPGYVVSALTPDGYLRLQRLPQNPPHRLFDQLLSAAPVDVVLPNGRRLTGVVAGPSVHLQPGRVEPAQVRSPEDMYVDLGAASAAEVRRAGADLLDAVAPQRSLLELADGTLVGQSSGDRFGAAVLLEVLRHLQPARLQGTTVLAFATQQWLGGRGLERLVERFHPDELIYLGRALPVSAEMPASGVLALAEGEPGPLVGELGELARQLGFPLQVLRSGPLLPRGYQAPPQLPQRRAHLSVGIAWPATPAEAVRFDDLAHLTVLLEKYLQGEAVEPTREHLAPPLPKLPERPRQAPQMAQVLQALVETTGVSTHEEPVRAAIERLLPPWAHPETDASGNLILRWPAGRQATGSALVFVAHMDEIGFRVQQIEPDGRLRVESLGGGRPEYFLGHPVLVFGRQGPRPGILELPAESWRQGLPSRGVRTGELFVNVGAHSPAEVAALGIAPGDVLTIPKRYRPLLATRASARSFDDRVGCAALIVAAWALGPNFDRPVSFVWSTEEELGLRGAAALAARLAAGSQVPSTVFAIDTFVSSDSPLESKRFADAPIGQGFVVRAVDNSNIVPPAAVTRVVALARAAAIAVQYGVTGGGNDGAVFQRYGTVDVALGWPLRYSHSPGEVIDVRDATALGRAVAELARRWPLH